MQWIIKWIHIAMNNKKLRGTNVVAEHSICSGRLLIWLKLFSHTQRSLVMWKYYEIRFCLHMDSCLNFCVCIWITWNNFKQMLKTFNDCLFVLKIVECLKIVYFVPMKLLNLKILCWKQLEFVESNTSLFNRKALLKSYVWLFIHYRILLNIDCTLLNI